MTLVVVAGFLPFNSGKTRLAARLARALRERGVKVKPCKPIGAHNVWEQHFSVEYSMMHRILVGGDAIRLAKAAELNPADVQPVDLLLSPPDITRYLTKLRDYLRASTETFSQTVVARVDVCSGGRVERHHLLVGEVYERLPPSIRGVIDELVGKLEPKPIRVSLEAFTDMVASGELIAAADMCTVARCGNAQLTILESFNDVLVPVPRALEADYFLVAAPGRAVLYHGSDVRKVVGIVATLRPGYTRSHELLNYIKPLKVFSIDFAYTDDQVGEDVERIADTLLQKHEEVG